MYETFFGMDHRPFAPTPNPKCFLETDALRGTREKLARWVSGGEGIALVTAGAGMGKTLFCQKQAELFRHDSAVVFLANSNFNNTAGLLQAILYELDQPYLRMEEQELRLQLITTAKSLRPMKQSVLLIIDEAHRLPTPLLEEIRTITNLTDAGEPLVRVILCGQIELEEKLADPELEALNQRISCQLTLEPLSLLDSANYVDYRLRLVKCSAESVFSEAALDLICRACDGIPRYLNQLCDHSLLLSYIADISPVSVELVQEALNDLKQLPLNWNLSALPPELETESGEESVSEALVDDGSLVNPEEKPVQSVNRSDEVGGSVPVASVEKLVFEVGADPEPAAAEHPVTETPTESVQEEHASDESITDLEPALEKTQDDCSSGLVESLMIQEQTAQNEAQSTVPDEQPEPAATGEINHAEPLEETPGDEPAAPGEEKVQDRYVQLAMGKDVSGLVPELPKSGMPPETDPHALTIGPLDKSHMLPQIQAEQAVTQPWSANADQESLQGEIAENETPDEVTTEDQAPQLSNLSESPIVPAVEDAGDVTAASEKVDSTTAEEPEPDDMAPVTFAEENHCSAESVIQETELSEEEEAVEEISEELLNMQLQEEQLAEALELESLTEESAVPSQEESAPEEEETDTYEEVSSLEESLRETVYQMLEETQDALTGEPRQRPQPIVEYSAQEHTLRRSAEQEAPAPTPVPQSKPRRRYSQLFSLLRRREFGE